jgi:hypothetical protein
MVSSFYFSAYGNSRPSVSEEELKEKHANMKGEVLDGNHLLSASSRHHSTQVNADTDSTIMKDDYVPTKKGMILPFAPLSLTFDDIKYSVDMPQVKYRKLFPLHY